MSFSPPPPAPPVHEPVRARTRTDRRVLWGAVLALGVLTTVRLSGQLLERIASDAQVRGLTADLHDPALAELAVRAGVTLAVVASVIFQGLYLLLCATIDERLLPGAMITTGVCRGGERRTGVGFAVLVGAGATIPVQLVALTLGVAAPKDSPLLYLWLIGLVTVAAALPIRRSSASGRSARTWLLVPLILAAVAALSLAF